MPSLPTARPVATIAPTAAFTAARSAATSRAVARRSIADLDSAAKGLERELRGLASGTVVFSDGKTPCPAGPWADDCLVSKDGPGDPNHCVMSGGPWLKPMLELPTGCDTPGLQLVPLSVGERAQGILRELLADVPREHHSLDEKKTWFWSVMRCCTLAGLSTNLSPFWFGMAPNRDLFSSYGAYVAAYPEKACPRGTPESECYSFVKDYPYGASSWLPPYPVINPLPAQEARESRDRRAVVHPNITAPYHGMMTGLGWNRGATAQGSLYQRLLALEPAALTGFGGGYGCNGAQAAIYGAGGGTYVGEGSGVQDRRDLFPGYGFVFPSAALAVGDPGAFNDKGRAKRQCERLATLPADQQLAAIFAATHQERGHFVHGWYFADMNIVGRRLQIALGAPIGAFREQRWEKCWAPTAAYFIERAEAIGRWWAALSLGNVVKKAVVAYILDLEYKLVQLIARGVDPGITPSGLRALRDAVYAEHVAGASATTGTVAAVAGALNGVVGTVLQVVNVLLGGLITLMQSGNNPANSPEYALVPQPLVLRTPRLDSVCSFSAEREGGVGGLYMDFTDTSRWGSAPLRELAEGRDAPAALRDGANTAGGLALVAGLRPRQRSWGPYIAVGVVAVGGAALWRWLR